MTNDAAAGSRGVTVATDQCTSATQTVESRRPEQFRLGVINDPNIALY